MTPLADLNGLQDLNAAGIVMLIAGTLLFLILVGGLISMLVKDKNPLPLLPFFFVTFAMIGFPFFSSITLNDHELIVAKSALNADIAAVQEHPNNPASRARLEESMQKTRAEAAKRGKTAEVAQTLKEARQLLENPRPPQPTPHKPEGST